MPRGVARDPIVPPSEHRVAIAGLGRLGLAAARARAGGAGLSRLGLEPHAQADLAEGITGYHGADGLPALLAQADTLVCLLPLTDETRGFLGLRPIAARRPCNPTRAGASTWTPLPCWRRWTAASSPTPRWTPPRRSRCRPTTRCGAIPR